MNSNMMNPTKILSTFFEKAQSFFFFLNNYIFWNPKQKVRLLRETEQTSIEHRLF